MKICQKKHIPGLAIWLVLTLPTISSPFELRPMTQAFEPSGRGTNRTFTIYNDLSEEVAVSVTIKGRAVDAEGVETLSDTKDFAIFPQQILLKGKSSQVVRVRWQGASSLTSERSYRITAEEVPLKNSPAQSSGSSTAAIKLILRFGGTIYVASPQARADVVVASARAIKESGGDLLEVILENRGQRHAIIDRPSLSLKAGEATHQIAESDLAKTLAGENILAGGTRRIHLPWPNGLPLGPVEAKLNASFTH